MREQRSNPGASADSARQRTCSGRGETKPPSDFSSDEVTVCRRCQRRTTRFSKACRRAAIAHLIAAHQAEYEALLRKEQARQGRPPCAARPARHVRRVGGRDHGGLCAGRRGAVAVARHRAERAADRIGWSRRQPAGSAAWAGRRELKPLRVRRPQPGRIVLGRTVGLLGRLLAGEDCHSVLVFGPPVI